MNISISRIFILVLAVAVMTAFTPVMGGQALAFSTRSADAGEVTPPDIAKLNIQSTSTLPGKATITAVGSFYTEENVRLEIKSSGKVILDTSLEYEQRITKTLSIPYDKSSVFECRVYVMDGSKKVYGTSFITLTQKSVRIAKPKNLHVTRISSKKASLIWSKVDGVTGYYVFWKNKKVRKLSKTSFVYKKSGAGKGTYKIVPYLAQSGKTFSGPGKTGKPKKNVIKFSGNSLNPKSYHGEICKFIVTKVELSGSTYKVTGYAINGSRNSTCEGFESLKITLKQSGKTVARKTVKKDFIIKPRSKKKLTFEIKGKSGKDLPGYGLKWNTVANEIFE